MAANHNQASIHQSSVERLSGASRSYYMRSKYSSISSLSAFERIRINLSRSPKNKTPVQKSPKPNNSPKSLKRGATDRQQYAGQETSGVAIDLSSYQRLLESRLRVDDLPYQKLLVLEVELDLMIANEEATRKTSQRRIDRRQSAISFARKEIADKQKSVIKGQEELNLFYEYLTFLKNPKRQLKASNIKLERENWIEQHYRDTARLLVEEASDYDAEILSKEAELAQLTALITHEKEEFASQRQLNRSRRRRSKLQKLEERRMSLMHEAVESEKHQLNMEAELLSKEIEKCREISSATAIHLDGSQQITNGIIDSLRNDFSRAAQFNKEIPNIGRKLVLMSRSKEKHTFKRQAQQKKIELLRQKIDRAHTQSSSAISDPPHHSTQ